MLLLPRSPHLFHKFNAWPNLGYNVKINTQQNNFVKETSWKWNNFFYSPLCHSFSVLLFCFLVVLLWVRFFCNSASCPAVLPETPDQHPSQSRKPERGPLSRCPPEGPRHPLIKYTSASPRSGGGGEVWGVGEGRQGGRHGWQDAPLGRTHSREYGYKRRQQSSQGRRLRSLQSHHMPLPHLVVSLSRGPVLAQNSGAAQ